MIKESFAAIGTALRGVLKSPVAFMFFAVLYIVLLVAVYLFVSTGVATPAQLVLTLFTAILAPLMLLLMQTAGARFGIGESSTGRLIGWTIKNFWKILLIGVPLVGLTVLAVYLFSKMNTHFAAATTQATPHPTPSTSGLHGTIPSHMRWQDIFSSSLELLVLGILLPVIAMQFWLEIAENGILTAVKRSFRVIARALSAKSMVVYCIGLVIFGLLPFFLIFTRTPVKTGWLELTIFSGRVLLAFLFTLVGWLVTFRALGLVSPDRPEATTVPATVSDSPAAQAA